LEKTTNKNLIIWGSFFLLTLMWGSSFILVKRALQGGFTPFEVASMRMVSAMTVLLVPAIMALRTVPKDKLPYVAISGLISMLIPAFLFCTAQVHISSSVASILNALTPAFTFLVGVFAFRQPTNGKQILGLLIGFLGTLMLILVNSKGEFTINAYALLILVATLLYGTNVNMVKAKLSGLKPVHLSALAVSASGMAAILYLLSSGSIPHVYQNAMEHPTAFGAMVLLGAMGTAAATLVFNFMLQYTTSVFASAITYFIPIVGVLWGLLDGEVLVLQHYLGMLLIIGGVLILNKGK
jgi:drug/metabolite transporter (DMT)-like permease